MAEVKIFLYAIFWDHWMPLMSCAAFTLIGVVVLAFNKSNRWALWATFGVAVAMLLLASFLAWRDQYRENEAGRVVGSLAFGGVACFVTGNNVQLGIVLKNAQTRLIEYHMDTINVEIESKKADDAYINRGGYIYYGTPITFRASIINDVNFSRDPVLAEIEYTISYHIVGSAMMHHSSKRLGIEFHPATKEAVWVTVNEHED